MEVTFQQEELSNILEELKPLLERHWQEVARNKDLVPLNPEYSAYLSMGRKKYLRVYTARLGEKLIGYAIYFVRPHGHYKDHLWALSDIFWLDPESRGHGAGKGLFQFVENQLRDEGVTSMHTTSKVEHPAAGRVLEGLGHTLIEYGHAKILRSS